MYSDRLEILSHGGLPRGMTEKQFYDGISHPRNATLMRIFLTMGLTEHTGHGIPTIISKYGKKVFDITDNYIKCVIPFDAAVMNASKNVGMNVGMNVGLNSTQKKILKLLLDNPNLTAETLASLIGVSKRTAERNLSDLKQKGKIERIGSKRDGQWIVIR